MVDAYKLTNYFKPNALVSLPRERVLGFLFKKNMKKEIEFALWVAENTYTSHYDDDGVLIFGSDIYNEDYLTIERLYELFKQDTQ